MISTRRVLAVAIPLVLVAVPTQVYAQAPKRAPAVAKVTVPAQETVAQTTIYKHVDERGHVTYTNRPMKGAEVVELEPITVIPNGPLPTSVQQASNFRIQPQQNSAQPATAAPPVAAPMAAAVAIASGVPTAAPAPSTANFPQVALVQPIPASVLPSVDASTQKMRDDSRRRILEDEMMAEQKLLADAVLSLTATESDRTVIEQMRQAAAKLTPSSYAEARRNYEAREDKLRTLQESVSTHEKNVTALKKELAALR